MHDSYTHFHASPGTRPGTRGTPLFLFFKKVVMDKAQTSRTIRCTPENAADMQRLVKSWPDLHALVQQLQAQDLFPGLRTLSITVTGDAAVVAGGLAAVTQINAPQRD